jgi:hypothetical protein
MKKTWGTVFSIVALAVGCSAERETATPNTSPLHDSGSEPGAAPPYTPDADKEQLDARPDAPSTPPDAPSARPDAPDANADCTGIATSDIYSEEAALAICYRRPCTVCVQEYCEDGSPRGWVAFEQVCTCNPEGYVRGLNCR